MERLPHPPESADAMEGKKGWKSKIEKNIHMRLFIEVKTFLERKKENTRDGGRDAVKKTQTLKKYTNLVQRIWELLS